MPAEQWSNIHGYFCFQPDRESNHVDTESLKIILEGLSTERSWRVAACSSTTKGDDCACVSETALEGGDIVATNELFMELHQKTLQTSKDATECLV